MRQGAEKRVGQAQENETIRPGECPGAIRPQEAFSCLPVIELVIPEDIPIVFNSCPVF